MAWPGQVDLALRAKRPLRPAPPAQPAKEAETPYADEGEDENRGKLAAWRGHYLPSWSVSMVTHMVLLLVLALWTLEPPQDENQDALVVSTSTPVREEMQEFELDETIEELPESEEVSLEALESEMEQFSSALAVSAVEVAPPSFEDLVPSEADFAPSIPSGLEQTELGDAWQQVQELGKPVSFYGSKVTGRFAVVFDITGSMFHSVRLVLRELESPKFAHAEVVAVFGGSFKKATRPTQLVPYRTNENVHFVEIANDQGKRELRDEIYRRMIARRHTLSLTAVRSKGTRQSLGVAIELLLAQPSPPTVIFVFSDFMDGVDQPYMNAVQQLAIQKKVKVVVYHPKKFNKDRDAYAAFAKATKGELREGLSQ
ncbi:MAG: hypothetical protein MI757_22400 [Pirellulales bacterium]|nr:hypothetical protein [Pirellulales bacterium]